MNPQTIKLIAMAFSMKSEIKLIFITVLVICLLPILTVLILTQEGIDLVSGSLVTRDSQTAQVDIHDPGSGDVVYQVNRDNIKI